MSGGSGGSGPSPPDGSGRRVENLLGALVVALSDEIDSAVTQAAGQGGEAPAALVQLADHPDLSVDGLRRRLGLTHSAVVRLVDRLVDRGLVIRSRSGTDGRATLLRLSPRGDAVAASVLQARAEVMTTALAGLSRDQRRALETVLDRLLGQLPRDADHSSRLCRLCCLGDCPMERCPVELRWREFRRHPPRRS